MAQPLARSPRRPLAAWTPRAVALPCALLVAAPLVVLIVGAVLVAQHRPGLRTPHRRPAPGTATAPAPVASRRRLLPRFRLSSILLAGGAMAAAVVTASTGALGSYAFLNSQATVASGSVTLTAGSLGTTINGSSSSSVAVPGSTGLLAGDYYAQALTVGVTGNVSGSVAAALTAASTPYQVLISASACPAAGYTTSPAGTVITTTPTVLGTIAKGGSVTGCLTVGLPSTAAATTTTGGVTAATASAALAVAFTTSQASG